MPNFIAVAVLVVNTQTCPSYAKMHVELERGSFVILIKIAMHKIFKLRQYYLPKEKK